MGLTSGQLVTLCWQLPATWGGASGNEGGVVLPLPERRVCWGQRDGMAVRHIAWQKTSEVYDTVWCNVLCSDLTCTLIHVMPCSRPSSRCWSSVRSPHWLLCNHRPHPPLMMCLCTLLYMASTPGQYLGSQPSPATATSPVPWTAQSRPSSCPSHHTLPPSHMIVKSHPPRSPWRPTQRCLAMLSGQPTV